MKRRYKCWLKWRKTTNRSFISQVGILLGLVKSEEFDVFKKRQTYFY